MRTNDVRNEQDNFHDTKLMFRAMYVCMYSYVLKDYVVVRVQDGLGSYVVDVTGMCNLFVLCLRHVC